VRFPETFFETSTTAMFNLVKATKEPQNAVSCGHQNDGSGTLYAAVAHTDHGNIPAKAKGNSCWYPYGGEEKITNNFSYVTAKNWKLVKSSNVPASALRTGHQTDGAGDLYAVVAHTQYGDIPGKGNGKGCWYAYNSHETSASDYSYVVSTFDLVRHSTKPPNAINCGHQNDGAGTLCAAVAHTEHGDIPGKAKGDTCWYPYGDKETSTKNFSWVVAVGWRTEKGSSPPAGALKVGHQNDGTGDLYAAVAHTEHGDIPGKAKGDTCWYPYGDKETHTKNFSWIVV